MSNLDSKRNVIVYVTLLLSNQLEKWIVTELLSLFSLLISKTKLNIYVTVLLFYEKFEVFGMKHYIIVLLSLDKKN